MANHPSNRKKNQIKRLKGEESKFIDLAEKSLAGVYLIQDWVFKYVNPKFSEIFGYSIEEMIDKIGPKSMATPEDWPMVEGNICKRLSGEMDSIHYEFKGITKRGDTINLEVYGSSTLYKGSPAVIGTLLDITKRKRAEELLRQAEEKYRGIFENAVEGIFQIQPDGRFLSVNPALKEMLGYGLSEIDEDIMDKLGTKLFVHPESRIDFWSTLEKDGVIKGFKCELYKRDGNIIWVSMNARRVHGSDGSTLYYEGSVEDISEKKDTESELTRLNEFNKAIIENAPVAIFTINKEGFFTSVNPALAAISGLKDKAEEKLIGFNWLKNPYTIKCGLAEYIRRGLEGESFHLTDFPFMTYKGDRNLYMDFQGVPLIHKDGIIEGLLCIIEETTERVKITARLMQEAKMAAVGRLAAGIAHELNNPLATLVAYSELAYNYLKSYEERMDKNTNFNELKTYLDTIQTEAFRCKNVVSDVLNLPWKEVLKTAEWDINTLLNNIIEPINTKEGSYRVIRDLQPSLPRVKGDITALRQVFSNIISNALDAIENSLDATICVRTRHINDYVQVEIADNGVGIPGPIIEKIFEPFFTTKEPKKGIGLGLAICHELVSNMGGTIRAEGIPGHGAIFYVNLPVRAD